MYFLLFCSPIFEIEGQIYRIICIVAESYLGTLAYELQTNTWLLSWLEEEYRPEQVVDGTYYKYYFRKAR